MPERETFDRVATGLMVLCALVMTIVFLRRELRQPPDPNKPVLIDDWEEIAVGDLRIGASSAKVVVVEFSDFQCPVCAQLAKSLRELRIKYPADLQVIYRELSAGAAAPVSHGSGSRGTLCGQRRPF